MSSEAEMRGPDFFIVGAPKCGTTAMDAYLKQHPEIGMCPWKEIHYYGSDLKPRTLNGRAEPKVSRERYMELFSAVQDRARLGEAAVWYLYSPRAAIEIHEACPGADIVVMLRDPVEMLHSLHSQLVFVGLEPVEDFEAALALDEERERSGSPAGFQPHSYRSAIHYAEQLRRYVDLFGPEHVHTILYEDFRDDTLGCFQGLCRFLGVDDSFAPAIEVVNPNKSVKNRGLRDAVRQPPRPVRTALHATTSQATRRRLGATLNRINTRYEQREPVPQAVRDRLRPEVERQVAELDELIGLDASRWL